MVLFMLENYVLYLRFMEQKLNKFFEKQKPYIFCKKGCAKCCQKAQFPYSQIEFEYLLLGARQLDMETRNIISENIGRVLAEKENFEGENFRYDCPFLIDNVCSVYNYRGIICRSFGLANVGSDGKMKVPFCCFDGLNYSNVMDGNKVSMEKFKKLGVKEEPLAFNTNYEFLTDADFENGFKFKFGEKKPLIEWFIK